MIFPDADGKNNVLCIKLDWEGCFNAVVKYNGVPVSQGQFTVISLNCELLDGGKGGIVIPFHAQILRKFTRHVFNQSLSEKPQGNEIFTTKPK